MPFSAIERDSTVVASKWANEVAGAGSVKSSAGHVNRLHRGDRALGRRGDALLQRAHVGGERRLITDRRRDAAEQRRHFRARLREAEDVVDEEQHVLALVAEIFGDGEARQRDAHARARRLVHLAEHQRAFRLHALVGVMRIGVDLGLDELVIEVVAFARALADAGEHRIAAVRLGDVVDQLLDQHRLADARAAEQADLAALGVGRHQIHDLDAGDEDLRFRRLLDIFRRRRMDRHARLHLDRAGLVDRLADHVHDAAERALADRHRNRLAGVGHFLAAHQPFRNVHGDAAHVALAEMLRDFQHQPIAVVDGLQRVENRGKLAFELHVHDRADHLGDVADVVCARHLLSRLILRGGGGSERLGARDDFDQFLGDHRLARAVVAQGVFLHHFAGVAGGRVHRAHLRAEEGGHVLQQPAIDAHRHRLRQQLREDLALVRLVVVARRVLAFSPSSGGMSCCAVGICEITDLNRA